MLQRLISPDETEYFTTIHTICSEFWERVETFDELARDHPDSVKAYFLTLWACIDRRTRVEDDLQNVDALIARCCDRQLSWDQAIQEATHYTREWRTTFNFYYASFPDCAPTDIGWARRCDPDLLDELSKKVGIV